MVFCRCFVGAQKSVEDIFGVLMAASRVASLTFEARIKAPGSWLPDLDRLRVLAANHRTI